MRHLSLPIACALLLAACASAPSPKPAMYAGEAAGGGLPGNDLLYAVAWMQTGIEHDLVYEQTYRTARQKLLQALADPHWDALAAGERNNDPTGLPTAIIVDVDETVLDNGPFEARMVRDNVAFDAVAWNAWVQQAAAKPLPGALEYAKFAAAHGVTMFYVSNREVSQSAATRKNLAAAGFPLTADDVLNRGAATPGCESRPSDKGCRRRLIAQHYRVVAMVGDQLGDFIDGAETDNATRTQRIAPYREWFGERWFVLPNAAYGSWEKAVTKFNADAGLRGNPRAALHAALRTD